MAEYEYEEENLDDFMIKASSILSEEDNPERETVIESLKQHLLSISNKQFEMQNFFKTLNLVIFNQKNKKIIHKQAFKLYPIIFSFNPNSSFYYIDFFLFCINGCISEENKSDFAYLSIIFSEVVLSFFSDEKNNSNLIMKNYLLDDNKKYKLYEKLLNFCNEKIKTNKKTEQSFGCLLLTELIEKCPIIMEEKYLESLFKIISNYLDDRFFECKLDLLNCTISLIFTTESKFKPYANICLFRVLDYLTDEEWMKRKLAINIVYTLIFYCKEEIMNVKENIVEFLKTLKEDPVEEVREVCIQTLKFIEENETKDINKKEDEEYNRNKDENKNINEIMNNNNINNNTYLKNNENKILNKTNNEININKKNKNAINKSKNNINKIRTKDVQNYNNEKMKNNNEEGIINNENNIKGINNNIRTNIKNNQLLMKQKANEEYIKKKLLKERYYLEKKEKELNEKTKSNINIISNNNEQKGKSYKPKKKQTISKLIKEFAIPNSINKNDSLKNEKKNNEYLKDNINQKEKMNNLKNNEQFNEIYNQLNEIQKEQNKFLSLLKNLHNSIDDNYLNLNERILVLENHYNIQNNSNFDEEYI